MNPEFNRGVFFAGVSPVKRKKSRIVCVALLSCVAMLSASGRDKASGGSNGKSPRERSAIPAPTPRKSATPLPTDSYKKSPSKSGARQQQDLHGADASLKKLGGPSGNATNGKKLKKDLQPNGPAAQAEGTPAPNQDRHEISKGQTAVLPGRQSTKDADKSDSSEAAAGATKKDGGVNYADDPISVKARLDAYEKAKDSENDSLNPYNHGGVIDREQAAKDAKAWYKFKNEAVGASPEDVEKATTSNADPREFGRAEEALKNARQHEAEVYLAGGDPEDAEAGKNEILTKGLVRGAHDKELKAIQDTGVNLGLDRAGFAKGKPGQSAQDRLKDLATRQRRGEDVSAIGNDAPLKGKGTGTGSGTGTGTGTGSGTSTGSSGNAGNAAEAPAKDPPKDVTVPAPEPPAPPLPEVTKPTVTIDEPQIVRKHKPKEKIVSVDPKTNTGGGSGKGTAGKGPQLVIIGKDKDGNVKLGRGGRIGKVDDAIEKIPAEDLNFQRGIPDAGEKGTVDEDLKGPITGKTGRSGGGPPTPPPLLDTDDQKKNGPTWDNSSGQRDRYHGGGTQGQTSGSNSEPGSSSGPKDGGSSGRNYGSKDQSAHNDEPLDDPKEHKTKDPDKPAKDTEPKEKPPEPTKSEGTVEMGEGNATDETNKHKGDTTTGPDSPDSGTAVGSKPNPVDGGPVNLPPGFVRRKGPIDEAIEQGKPKKGGERINPGSEGEGHRGSSGAVDAAKKLNGMLGNPGSAGNGKPQGPALERTKPGGGREVSNPSDANTDEMQPLPGDTQKQFGEKGAGDETSVDAPHGQTTGNTTTDSSKSSGNPPGRERAAGKSLKDRTILDAVLADEEQKRQEQMTKKTIKPN